MSPGGDLSPHGLDHADEGVDLGLGDLERNFGQGQPLNFRQLVLRTDFQFGCETKPAIFGKIDRL